MNRLAVIPAAFFLPAMIQTGSVTMEPGQWEFVTQMTGLDLDGAPPEVLAAARSSLGEPRTQGRCLSPEDVVDPGARLARPEGAATDCVFSRRTFANGAIDVAGRCTASDGSTIDVGLSGTYTQTAIDARITAALSASSMRLAGTMTARRIGICSPQAG